MTQTWHTWMLSMAGIFPLWSVAFLGSFLEEFVLPIPAPLFLGTVGHMALRAGEGVPALFFLALFATVGRTLAMMILYVLGDRFEDVVTHRFGRMLGVKHEDIENIGKRFSGGWRDTVLLLTLRVAPFVPTVPLSFACGIFRINFFLYSWTSLVGTLVKSVLYIALGYFGSTEWRKVLASIEHVSGAMLSFMTVSVLLVIVIWYFVRRSRRGKAMLDRKKKDDTVL